MAVNKYELRSDEVQEIMRKAPNMFISRGNILVILILLTALYFLNRFRVYEKAVIPIEIVNIHKSSNQEKNWEIVLSTNISIPKNVGRNQSARLFIKNTILNGKIDSIGYTLYEQPIIFFESHRSDTMVQDGTIGHIEITTKEKTIVSMLVERVRH